MATTDKLERIYTVPLKDAYEAIRTKRSRRAISLLRAFVVRHMKSDVVVISNTANSFIWRRSMQSPPRYVKIRAIRQDGKVNVYLADEKPEEKKQEKKTEPKKESKKDEKKEDKKVEASNIEKPDLIKERKQEEKAAEKSLSSKVRAESHKSQRSEKIN